MRAHHPTLENLILDMISLDYHETLSVAAGHQAEAARQASMEENFGSYLLVVDGAIPTKDGGIYCKVANRTIQEHLLEAAEGAAAIVAIGSCASWGGIPSSGPNPDRRGRRVGNSAGQDHRQHSRLSSESLQLPQHRAAVRGLRHLAGAG